MGKLSKNFVGIAFVLGLAACGNWPPDPDTSTGSSGGDSSSSSSSGGMSDPCFDYASFNGMSPTVKFSADVLPIFRGSCGVNTSCHSSPAGPAGQPYLGPPLSDGTAASGQIDTIFMQNVNAVASKAKTMKIVNPGSPETSFLMHKMDASLTCDFVKCEAGCGVSMPKDATILAQSDRDTVRRWIAQGAKQD